MECGWCGSHRHNTSDCDFDFLRPALPKAKDGRPKCPKCGRIWGQSNYARDCCDPKYAYRRVFHSGAREALEE